MSRPQASASRSKVVVLGDGFLGQADWDAWFPTGHILDLRGVALTHDELPALLAVLSRVDAHAIIVTLGSVDGAAGIVDLRAGERTVAEIERILLTLHEALPDALLILQALPPADQVHAAAIRALDERLQRLCGRLGVGFLPVWNHFGQSDGSMNPDLTVASGDLNQDGFETWLELLDHAGLLLPADRPLRLPSPRHVYLPPERGEVGADAAIG